MAPWTNAGSGSCEIFSRLQKLRHTQLFMVCRIGHELADGLWFIKQCSWTEELPQTFMKYDTVCGG